MPRERCYLFFKFLLSFSMPKNAIIVWMLSQRENRIRIHIKLIFSYQMKQTMRDTFAACFGGRDTDALVHTHQLIIFAKNQILASSVYV